MVSIFEFVWWVLVVSVRGGRRWCVVCCGVSDALSRPYLKPAPAQSRCSLRVPPRTELSLNDSTQFCKHLATVVGWEWCPIFQTHTEHSEDGSTECCRSTRALSLSLSLSTGVFFLICCRVALWENCMSLAHTRTRTDDAPMDASFQLGPSGVMCTDFADGTLSGDAVVTVSRSQLTHGLSKMFSQSDQHTN